MQLDMSSGKVKRAKNDVTEVRTFKKYVKTLFTVYDADNSGFLDLEEFRGLLDDLRESMFLPKSDETIFSKIILILDEDKNGQIEQQELFDNIEKIFLIVKECGKEKADEIKEIFDEYDFDDIGRIHRKNVYPFFNDFANMEVIFVYNKYQNIPDLETWQVDYIISVIDDNDDEYLEYEEVIVNYSKIIKSMLQLTKTKDERTKKKNNSGTNNIFCKINAKIEEKHDEEKLKKGICEYEKIRLAIDKNLDHMTRYRKQQTKALIPVNNQINRRASVDHVNTDGNCDTQKHNQRAKTPDNTGKISRIARINAFVSKLTASSPRKIQKESLEHIIEDESIDSEASLSDNITKQNQTHEYKRGISRPPIISISPSHKHDSKSVKFSPSDSFRYSKEFKIKSNKVEKQSPVTAQTTEKDILMERMKIFGFGYNKCKDENQKKTHSKKFFEEFTKDDILLMAKNAKFVKHTYEKLFKRVNIFIDSLKDFLTYKIVNNHETTNRERTDCFDKGEHVPFEFGAPIDNANKPDFRRIVQPEELLEKQGKFSTERSTQNIKKLFNYDPIAQRIAQKQNKHVIKSDSLQVSIDKIKKHVLHNMDDNELEKNKIYLSPNKPKQTTPHVIRKSFFLTSAKKTKEEFYNIRKSSDSNTGKSVDQSNIRRPKKYSK